MTRGVILRVKIAGMSVGSAPALFCWIHRDPLPVSIQGGVVPVAPP